MTLPEPAEAIHPVVRGIIANRDKFSAAQAFSSRYRLDDLTRQAQRLLAETDLPLVPTAPCMPTIDEVCWRSQSGSMPSLILHQFLSTSWTWRR